MLPAVLRPNPKLPGAHAGEGAAGRGRNVFSAKQFSKGQSGPWMRFGDLLPLPLPVDRGFGGAVGDLRSRRSQQRVVARRTILRREVETVRCINQLAGFEDEAQWPIFAQNFSQVSALSHIHRAHVERAPPVDRESDKAALVQLLKGRMPSSYFVSSSAGALAPYERGQVSLPADQRDPVDLASILPEKERTRLREFERQMLLSGEELAAVQERGFEGDLYVDPRLADDEKAYHDFVAELVESRLVSFTTTPRSQVGLFFVTKKNGKLRMIVDARRTNRLFRRPPCTQLGSADSWGRAESSEGGPIYFAQEDVKDFFYRLKIEKGLGEFFSLPKIDPVILKESLGYMPEEVSGILDHEDAPVFPHLRVLPMGFSWAFHLAHECHCNLARCTIPEAGHLVDRQAAPVLSTEGPSSAMLIYADNNNHFGVSPEKVGIDQQRMIECLHSHNLSTHELSDASTLAESLGVRLDGRSGRVCSTPTRDWRLHRALGALVFGEEAITGEELQVILGHITMRAMLNRQLMCILRHSYIYVQRSYTKRQTLWPSVRRELRQFRGLMVLGFADIFSGWDGQPLCTDACLSGYAVMEGQLSAEEAARVGRVDERWRFRREEGVRIVPR